MNSRHSLTAILLALAPTVPATADPCGMVPPIASARSIDRTGLQRTYVFFKDGVETIAIRPAFTGTTSEFGMLVPFPSPPSLKKAPDDLFEQIAAAADPPEVVVYPMRPGGGGGPSTPAASGGPAFVTGAKKNKAVVIVLNEEAVGQYQAVVLDAGSAAALKRWMDDHGFRFPDGMESVCQEYVDAGWCFVAIKARVGAAAAVEPRPGMRDAQLNLPPNTAFDGYVQAMSFRFEVDEPVIPMRLSAFNEGDLRNIVYVLTDQPVRIAGIDESAVKRQIDGRDLVRNVRSPLPVRVMGRSGPGTPGASPLPIRQQHDLSTRRDPFPKNGAARDQFTADLLAASTGRLLHDIEKKEKQLLNIGVALGLRPGDLDTLHRDALREEHDDLADDAFDALEEMTLTVIDGDFPRELIASTNLRLEPFEMKSRLNVAKEYDAKLHRPAPRHAGYVVRGALR